MGQRSQESYVQGILKAWVYFVVTRFMIQILTTLATLDRITSQYFLNCVYIFAYVTVY